MKKLIIASVLGIIFSATSTFGQGYAVFGGGLRTVMDNYSSPPFSGFDATFLWSTTAAASPMPFASPLNETVSLSSPAAWADIEGSLTGAGGLWTFATTGGANVIAAPGNDNGAFAYNDLAGFSLDNAGAPGTTDNFFVIAWDTGGGLYTTLSEAEVADAPVGWSSVFNYTLAAAPPAGVATETDIPPFGIDTPEPTTLALAGMGGLSMLFLRRKKA